MARRRRRLLRRALIALLVLVLAAGIGVGLLLRMLGSRPAFDYAPGVPGDLYVSRELTLDCSRTQERRSLDPCLYSFHTTSLGFRGLEVDLRPDTELVMLLGDGFSFAVALDGDNTLCDVINRKERSTLRGRDIACVNAGVPGYGIVDGHAYLRDRGHTLEPDLVIWVVAWDDVWEIGRPMPAREVFQCLDRSLLCLPRFLYLRYHHDLFYPIDGVMKGREESPREVFDALLVDYLAEAHAMEDTVRGWGGTLLFLTDRFEQVELRRAMRAEGFQVIELYAALEGRTGYVVDGHWDAPTHAAAADVLVDWYLRQRQVGVDEAAP